MHRESFGNDYYPLYIATQLIWQGESPYGPAATTYIKERWDGSGYSSAWSSEAGVAYPLPYFLLLAPFGLLPYTVSATVMLLISLGLGYQAVRLADNVDHLLLLPLCYAPFVVVTLSVQATLLVFGLSVLLILALQRRTVWLIGLLIPCVLLKPQVGILYALYALWWGWKHDRRVWLWAGGSGALLFGAAFWFQLDWISAWLQQVQIYTRVTHPGNLLPVAPLFLIAAWKKPWWVQLMLIQLCIFPLADFYATVPVLLYWIAVGRRAAYIAAALSWIWFLPFTSMTVDYIALTVLVPVFVHASWQLYQARQPTQLPV